MSQMRERTDDLPMWLRWIELQPCEAKASEACARPPSEILSLQQFVFEKFVPVALAQYEHV